MKSKDEIRYAIQRKRAGLTLGWIRDNSRKAVENLNKIELTRTAGAIAGYYAKGFEVQITPFMEKCLSEGRRVCVPRHRDEMPGYEWSWIVPAEAWRDGPWKIAEPARLRPVNRSEIEIAIIPAVAVDRQGRRLGHGGGNFDRLLSKLTCPKVAVVFEFQVMDEIPTEPHDVSIDFIVTENETYPVANQ